MLTEEQTKQIKQELIQQIQKIYPEEKKHQAMAQIQAMNNEQFEQFLIQNNLVKTGKDIAHGTEVGQEQKCIFCSIISGDIQSYKIDENKDAIAILEINPISKGHILIVPKEHFSEIKGIPKAVFSLAQKISKKIKTKLKPKNITITPQKIFEHAIISVLPVYENETLQSEKHQATPEELLELQNFLEKKSRKSILAKKPKVKKIKEEETKKLWLPKRIP